MVLGSYLYIHIQSSMSIVFGKLYVIVKLSMPVSMKECNSLENDGLLNNSFTSFLLSLVVGATTWYLAGLLQCLRQRSKPLGKETIPRADRRTAGSPPICSCLQCSGEWSFYYWGFGAPRLLESFVVLSFHLRLNRFLGLL